MSTIIKKLKISDVFVVGVFVLGLAFALTHRITHQENLIADNIIEVSPQ